MKKSLLTIALATGIFAAQAQTVVFSDDFESYTAGEGITAQGFDNGWKLWNASGANFEALVSNDFANSGNNSVHLLQATGDDIVYDVGAPITSGKYDVVFKMYIPSGREGYFNLMHNWDLNSTNQYEWAVDVFFSAAGQITWVSAAQQGGAGVFNHDEWFTMMVSIDLDADEGRLYYNGQMMHQFQWSLDNANGNQGLNQLKVVNFFAYGPSGSNGEYYIDDFELIESTGVNVQEMPELEVTVWPNPANQVVNVDLTGTYDATLTFYSIDGRVIDRFNTTSSQRAQLPVGHLSEGIYFIEVVSRTQRHVRKVVVRH